MPILWWVFEARGRLALVTAVCAVLVMLPNLAHGNPGFAQVGYRFIVDALPLLWVLLAIAFRDGLTRAASGGAGIRQRRHHLAVQRRLAGLSGLMRPGPAWLRAPGLPPATTGTGPPGRATGETATDRIERRSSDHMMARPFGSDQQVT